MLSRFTKKVFNSGGTWTAPAGVTQVLVFGMGGGAGGAGGLSSAGMGGQGGLGCTLRPVLLTVTPNTTYTITIGTGGTGGVANGGTGAAGGNTSFDTLMTWPGAPSTPWKLDNSYNFGIYRFRTIVTATNMAAYPIPGDVTIASPVRPYPNEAGVSASYGTSSGSYGGGGAGMSGEATGGAGGNGNSGGVGGTGGSAAANSGAGGGGGGSGTTGGAGGAGGSGQLIVMWVE